MRFSIVADCNWESKVDYVLSVLRGDEPTRSPLEYFYDRDYGDSVAEIGLVLMCRDPGHEFKQRIKLAKKEKILSLDVMLDLNLMIEADHPSRRRIVADALVSELLRILAKYRFSSFDRDRFGNDFREIVTGRLLGSDAGKRDHLVLTRAHGH
jgi:hypothetical protein